MDNLIKRARKIGLNPPGRWRLIQELADALEESKKALGVQVKQVIDDVVAEERESCAKVADEKDIYWNAVAYDKRQSGMSDIDASARAGSAMKIAADIRARE